MVDTALTAAIRVALRQNEIGNASPYVLSYARKGDSGGSFGVFQGDVHVDQVARATLQNVLVAAGLGTATVTRIVTAVAQPCPNGSPLTPADQAAADAALSSPQGQALVDAMDDTILQCILVQLGTCVDAVQSVAKTLDPGAQISVALWVNMSGPPTTLVGWLKGENVGGAASPAAATVTRADLQRYLAATKYFEENPRNLVSFEASVDAGLKVLADDTEVSSATFAPDLQPSVQTILAGATGEAPAIQPTADTAPQPAPNPIPNGKQQEDAMLGYFLSTLTVRAMSVKSTLAGDPVRQELFQELQSSLNSFSARFPASPPPTNHAAWAEAYRLERVLALVQPASSLVSELKRQTAEAVDERIPSASRLLASFEAALPLALDTSESPPALRKGGEAMLRPLLLQTLEELHWNSQRKFYARPIQKLATYRIVYLGIAAFLLFLAPYLIVYFEIFSGHDATLASWSGLPLYTALTAGLFGAFFSRLLYLQQNWNGLTLGAIMDARDVTSIILRGCVGMTGATMVYFFLQSDAMTGALLPKFSEIGFAQSLYPTKTDGTTISIRLFYPDPALALLVVWCFLAGFSERLVPSILESTEASLGKMGAPK
jgi:hypothetical protein